MGDIWSKISAPTINAVVTSISGIIGSIFKSLREKWDKLVNYRVVIDPKEEPGLKRAIFEEIKDHNLHAIKSTVKMVDGYGQAECAVNVGNYKFEHVIPKQVGSKRVSCGRVRISVKDDRIVVKTCRVPGFRKAKSINDLKNLVNDAYKKHNAPAKVMRFFTADGDKWTRPIMRVPRNFNNLRLSDTMKTVMADMDDFYSPSGKQQYIDNAWPYRRGYFLHGAAGTGKSMMSEIVANKYNMTIYLLSLNAKDMTDNTLINLVSAVPRNSVIVLDEVDKQLAAVKKNRTANVSIAGLLTALDGPQRLSEGTIVILTSNKFNILPNVEREALLRPGRIDKVFNFSN